MDTMRKDRLITIGIDPGKDGAMAIIAPNETYVIPFSETEYVKELGYIDRLLNGIAEKRVSMIMKATTKTEMDRVMIPKAPHYNGAEFITDEYHIPEEELIAWSQASLKGPLVGAGFKRYMQLFREFFPDESQTFKLGGVV